MKKFLATACAAVMTASMLVMSASAGVGDIKYEIKGTNKAPVMDGKVTQDEYAGNAPIVLDGKGKNTDAGGWVGNWPEGLVLKYYYTWEPPIFILASPSRATKPTDRRTLPLSEAATAPSACATACSWASIPAVSSRAPSL